MKINEILIRQDRVVYTLMILLASIGLFWGFWQHQHPAGAVGKAATAPPTATTAPNAKMILTR
jgi:hypothetical protein